MSEKSVKEKSPVKIIAYGLMIFTIVIMAGFGALGTKLILDGLMTKSATRTNVSDEEALKLCYFSQRSRETCNKLIEQRRLLRAIEAGQALGGDPEQVAPE